MTYRVSFVSPELSMIRSAPSRRVGRTAHPFERAVSTLFQDAFPAASARATPAPWRPSTDVIEDANGWTISLDVPGVTPDALEIVQEARQLTIRGSRSVRRTEDAAESAGERRVQWERVDGAFERRFELPEAADLERLQAELAHGVLTVRIGKVAPAQARRITVHVGPDPVATPNNTTPAAE
jgi:HSP20 family protein